MLGMQLKMNLKVLSESAVTAAKIAGKFLLDHKHLDKSVHEELGRDIKLSDFTVIHFPELNTLLYTTLTDRDLKATDFNWAVAKAILSVNLDVTRKVVMHKPTKLKTGIDY